MIFGKKKKQTVELNTNYTNFKTMVLHNMLLNHMGMLQKCCVHKFKADICPWN